MSPFTRYETGLLTSTPLGVTCLMPLSFHSVLDGGGYAETTAQSQRDCIIQPRHLRYSINHFLCFVHRVDGSRFPESQRDSNHSAQGCELASYPGEGNQMR